MELTQESDATLKATPGRWGTTHPWTPQALTLTSAFLLGSPPVTTETERLMGLATEALLGRRDIGGGRPVRLRSMPSWLPSGGMLAAREPFMVDGCDLSRQGEMQ